MVIDISELEQESRRRLSLIRSGSIKLDGNKLTFLYMYLDHLPNPFDSFYNFHTKEFGILIRKDAFMGGSGILCQEFELPNGIEKVVVRYHGEDISQLSNEERLKRFFSGLRNDDLDDY